VIRQGPLDSRASSEVSSSSAAGSFRSDPRRVHGARRSHRGRRALAGARFSKRRDTWRRRKKRPHRGRSELYLLSGRRDGARRTMSWSPRAEFGGSRNRSHLSRTVSNGFWKTEPTTKKDFASSGETTLEEHVFTFRDIRGTFVLFLSRREPDADVHHTRGPQTRGHRSHARSPTPPSLHRPRRRTRSRSGGNVKRARGDARRPSRQGEQPARPKRGWCRRERKENRLACGRDFQSRLHGGPRRHYSIVLRTRWVTRRGSARIHGRCVRGPRAGARCSPTGDDALSRGSPRGSSVHRADDYGVRRRRSSQKGRRGEVSRRRRSARAPGGRASCCVAYPWSLQGTVLFPANTSSTTRVKDNNIGHGTGVAKSSRVPHQWCPRWRSSTRARKRRAR